MILSFFVPGEPKPQGSGKWVPRPRKNGKMYAAPIKDEKMYGWREHMAAVAARAMGERPLVTEPVRVTLIFSFERPKGHYGSGKYASRLKANAPSAPVSSRTGDIDKLARCCLDALCATVIKDDAQVINLLATKRYLSDVARNKPGGVLIEVVTDGDNTPF